MKWVAVILVGTMTGCIYNSGHDYRHEVAAVASVQLLSAKAPEVVFDVVWYETSCWSYSGALVRTRLTTTYEVTITLEAKKDCVTVPEASPVEQTVVVRVPAPGDYLFRFTRLAPGPLEVRVRVQ